MTDILNFQIDDSSEGMRLDKFLAQHIQDVSRVALQKLIQSENVLINHQVVTSNKIKLTSGMMIEVSMGCNDYGDVSQIIPNYDIELDIIYEDNDLLIVNKQPGLTVHPGAGNRDRTMLNALVARGMSLSDFAGDNRLGIVHRIDKDTSGILVVAKNNKAHYALSRQIMDHTCNRVYQALCYGIPTPIKSSIDINICRDEKNRTEYRVSRSGKGKSAVTHYLVEKTFCNDAVSMIKFRLETGRTHQIRVHCQHKNIPIIGDPVYCSNANHRIAKLPSEEIRIVLHAMKRQALHASCLGFIHPSTNEYMEWSSPMPEDMQNIIQILG